MIINRYLTREVTNMLLVIVSVLMLAFLSQQIVRYLNYVAIGKIPTSILLELVSFEIPYLMALLLPLALYLGILLAYGRLYADQEMAVLQMSGFGTKRILRLTAAIGLAVMAVVLVLMLWVNPWISEKRQALMKSDEATLHLIQTVIPGRFQVSPDGKHVMYIEKLSLDRKRAENVFLAQEKPSRDNPDERSWMLVLADQGYQVNEKGSSDPFFVTTDGYRYEGVPGENDYKIIQFKRYMIRILQPDTRVTHQDDEALTSTALLNDYQNPKRAAEFQWRISIALSAFLLALLAVPLSDIKPRQGRYYRLLPAIIIYMIYINLMFVARHWVERSVLPVTLGMWWVHGIAIIAVVIAWSLNSTKWKGI